MSEFDLLVKNVRVVRPDSSEVAGLDIAVSDGRVARLAPGIDPALAATVVDGGGKLAFPGVVDAHQHWGIYNPLEDDTRSESRASAQGCCLVPPDLPGPFRCRDGHQTRRSRVTAGSRLGAARSSAVNGSTSYSLLREVCLSSLVSAIRSNGLKVIRSSLSTKFGLSSHRHSLAHLLL